MTKRFPRARLGLAGILIVAVHGLGAGAVSAQMGPSCQNPIPKKGNPVWVESAKVSAARASLKRVNDSLATNPSNPLAQDAVIRSKGDCEADLAVKNVGLFNGPARMCIAEAATLLGRLGDSSGYDCDVRVHITVVLSPLGH